MSDEESNPGMNAEMDRRLRAAQNAGELRVGAVHGIDLLFIEEYEQDGVILTVSWLDNDAMPTMIDLWIPKKLAPNLRQVLRELDSPRFRHLLKDPSNPSHNTARKRPQRSKNKRRHKNKRRR